MGQETPQRTTNLRKLLLYMTACLLLLLASCGQGEANNISAPSSTVVVGTVTPDSSAPPGNFLYSSYTDAIFLACVNTNGSLSGQTQDAKVQFTNGSEQVSSTHGSFTGTLTNGQVNLNFGGFLGFSSNITGTYDGTTLTLNFPTTNGGVGSFPFVPATNEDFNTEVSALQSTAANYNATVTTEEVQAAAQATTNANATYTTQSQQQAVANANQTVAHDLSAIQSDTSNLNQEASFDSVFSAYAQTWQQMQNDYQTEVNTSKNGCGDGNYNYGTVQYEAGNVKYDLGSIQYDDGNFDYQKNNIDGYYNSITQDISSIKSDWQALKQAVANNPSGTPNSNYQQSDIDSAISSGNNALGNAVSVVKKAKQTRAAYDDEASALNDKAQALPGTMGC